MEPRAADLPRALEQYLLGDSTRPLFVTGDAREVLRHFDDESVDCCMTSPPYWGHRQYEGGGLGGERDFDRYVADLVAILGEVKRVLRRTGSLWLNLGDSYRNKCLIGIPWRVALTLTDQQGWVLRNQVVWNKIKGSPDNTRDKLRNLHESVFHLVRSARGYYYDVDSIRSRAREARVVDGAVISATGVRGVRYRRQIQLSTSLTASERSSAEEALDDMLDRVRRGELADFRMIIRGQQRTTHSDSRRVSGRARELDENGFYFLRYHPKGSKPGDVWDIIPEDSQNRHRHYAPYPQDLCRLPLLATCPPDGVVIDPFCGTGTTMLVANRLGRKSVGIDLSAEYLEIARERCRPEGGNELDLGDFETRREKTPRH